MDHPYYTTKKEMMSKLNQNTWFFENLYLLLNWLLLNLNFSLLFYLLNWNHFLLFQYLVLMRLLSRHGIVNGAIHLQMRPLFTNLWCIVLLGRALEQLRIPLICSVLLQMKLIDLILASQVLCFFHPWLSKMELLKDWIEGYLHLFEFYLAFTIPLQWFLIFLEVSGLISNDD